MPGEALAQIELVLAEHIHGKGAIAQHHLMQIGCFLDADEDERWVERDGGEGIDGNAEAMLAIAGSYNSHASRKSPQHLAKIRLADVHRLVVFPLLRSYHARP